ncbi:MAG: RNA polymerase sigma factor [Patescibacteria group bacterium]
MLDGEENLITDAIRGEASAFGLLYDYYQPKIYRFIFFKTGRREEAEDLTHQVFLNAWQNVKNYKFQGFPFSSWLYQIARNQIIDHYRTRKETLNIENVDEPETVDISIEDKMDFGLEIKRVKKAILALNEEQQDVIIMRFIDDLSPKEISLTLDKPESTIRVLQHRAIKTLQKLLEIKEI